MHVCGRFVQAGREPRCKNVRLGRVGMEVRFFNGILFFDGGGREEFMEFMKRRAKFTFASQTRARSSTR